MARASDRRYVGIRRKGAGWQAYVTRGDHPRITRTFPLDTDPAVMQAWRQDVQADLRLTRKTRASRGMFEADAARYLAAVTALPTYAERQREIARWVEVFGQTPRQDITSADIRAVRDRWVTEPRSERDPRPISGATANKRLRALSNLYTVLDGRGAANPVRDVPEIREPSGRIRALDYAVIERIIAAMPDLGKAAKGDKRPLVSRAKATVRVLAYTGWPPSVLAQLGRRDVDFVAGVAHLPARRKGKGQPAVTVPLVPQALDALRTYDAGGWWGPFDRQAINRAWKRAAAKCQVPAVRLYDLRHSFLTAIGRASKDERAVQVLAQHGDMRTTRRYTAGSVDARLLAAISATADVLPQVPEGSARDIAAQDAPEAKALSAVNRGSYNGKVGGR